MGLKGETADKSALIDSGEMGKIEKRIMHITLTIFFINIIFYLWLIMI